MENNLLGWLFYRGLRAHLGMWRNEQWRLAKKRYEAFFPMPEGGYDCALCGCIIPATPKSKRPPKAYELTFDHIVPMAVILYGDKGYNPDLLFSTDNMQPTHRFCNVQKGHKHHI